jgi:DNA-binding NarL/FixJ family response regulator
VIKEAIKLAFFRLFEYLEHQHVGLIYRLQMARNKYLSSETHQSILVLRNEGYSMQEIANKLRISYNAVYYSIHRTVKLALTRIERGVGGPSALLSKRTSTLECLV